MSLFLYRLTRSAILHNWHLVWAACASLLLYGVSGPKNSAAPIAIGIAGSRLGMVTTVVIWLAIVVTRKNNQTVSWKQVAGNYLVWQRLGLPRQIAWAAFFVTISFLAISLGLLVGTLLILLWWRLW